MKRINRHCIVAAKISYNNYKENLEYFCIEALEDGLQAKLSVNACEYSLDRNTWNNLSAATNTPAVNTGDKIYFRGNLTPTSSNGIGTFTISKKCNVKGNIMSLLYGDDFEEQNDLTGKNYTFYKLFYNCTKIADASELVLPATKLASNCYYYMFRDCTSLVTSPALPATTLKTSCYSYMLYGCTSLVTAPALPATTLVNNCYSYMFQGCTSLVTSPELPATTLASDCYSYMFYGTNVLPDCSNIDFTSERVVASGGLDGLFAGTKITDSDLERILPKNNNDKYCLPVTTLANFCYSDMFQGCTSLVTAPELPATTLKTNCYKFMFQGCTSLVTAPELPATTLASSCYYSMFQGCSKLNNITMLATDISASSCLYNWVSGVSSSGTFTKNPNMASLPSGVSGIPSGWTVEDYVETNLITFTIDGVEYQAEEGMTWEEWCDSEYNKIQMVAIDTGSGFKSIGLNPPFNVLVFKGTTVYGHDLIITGGVYIQQYNDF